MKKLVILMSLLALLSSCAKKIPPAEPFDAAKTFGEANRLLEKKKFEEARQELYEVKRRETDMNYAPLAQLRLADSYLMEDEPELAVDEYRRFLKEYPSHKYGPYARYKIAMTYFDMIESHERGFGAAVKALDEFEALNELYPRNPYREEAEEKIRKCNEVLAEHEYMVGNFYYRKESWQGALDRFTGLRERYPEHREPEVLQKIASSFFRLGDKEKAGEYFDMLMKKYPESGPAKKAKRELGR